MKHISDDLLELKIKNHKHMFDTLSRHKLACAFITSACVKYFFFFAELRGKRNSHVEPDQALITKTHMSNARMICGWEGLVVGDEAPLGGVAQVVSHGVKVVGVHGKEGKEKNREVQVEVKREIEQLRKKRSSRMVWKWKVKDSRTI